MVDQLICPGCSTNKMAKLTAPSAQHCPKCGGYMSYYEGYPKAFWKGVLVKLTIILSTIIGTIAAGIAIYDYITDDTVLIEQRLSPEAMDALGPGDIIIDKRIIIDRGEDNDD